ncbi:MAG: beta-ketoacyl-ACP synthase II [Chloroflexi bacterium]|nr:beta-ketoacyl-ACP synthase II [Chloroflexota bacterium]
MGEDNRVVVTGLGAVTPIGNTVEEFWKNLTAGVSGGGQITQFDASALSVQIAAEVKDFDLGQYFEKKEAGRMSRRAARFAQFSLAASQQALSDSGLTIDDQNRWDVGVAVATGGGGVSDTAHESETLLTRGVDRVNPMFIPSMIANMASCQVSITFGLNGPAVTEIAACAAGVYALYDAYHILKRGDAKALLTGGTESAISPLAFISLGRLGALSKKNDTPTLASRPFDRDRDGFLFGEGGAILMLERLDFARARGARIYAELAGVAHNADAYHLTAPEPSGEAAARCMRKAIAQAGLTPSEIEYVCAHGTGTPLNDASETRAVKQVFGDHAYNLQLSSPKSMVGHLLGAAGAISAVTTVLTLDRGVIPPTINLDTPDPECDLDYVPNVAREKRVRTAIVNGFGFGGQNAVAVFKAWEE